MSLLTKGATAFLALTDTPDVFTGDTGKVAQVNVAEDALEFAAKKLTYTQIYNGAAPPSGNLKPLGSIPYRFEGGSTGQRQMFWATYNGDIYVGGGNGFGDGTDSKQFWKYNIATAKWTRLADLPGTAAFYCRPAYYDDKIYAVCAYSDDLPGYFLFVYTISTDTWVANVGVPASAHQNCYMCPTAAHLIIVSAGTDQLYEVEYADLTTWVAKVATTGDARQAQVIADVVYVIDNRNNMFYYDEPTEAWVDTTIAKPAFSAISRMWVEDTDAIWVINHQAGNPQLWMRSTGALAFVEQLQFPDGEDCIQSGHAVLPTGGTDWYVVYGVTTLQTILPDGCYGLIDSAGVWDLVSQAFVQGDDLIVDAKGVPVHCSVGGELREIVDTYLAMVTIAAETWDFTLSKDYDYQGVDIWRGY